MSIISYSKTPQAVDDSYSYLEDQLGLMTSGYLITLDVMANDLGGNSKSPFSVDDGFSNPLSTTDLLNADGLVNGVSAWETTASGNSVRINNGKLELDLSHDLASVGGTNINSLAAGEHIHDTFTYAIRMGNGTLSWAHVTFDVYGENDAATISGSATGVMPEDALTPVTGTLTVVDPDHDQSHTQTISNATSISGLGTYSVDADGHWSYVVDNAAVQYLASGETATDTFVVASVDGTAQQTVTVTINGSNDQTIYPTKYGPFDVTTADLNGDGYSDLITCDGDNVGVFLNSGNGTFQDRVDYHTPSGAYETVVGDFNGDGISDIAVAEQAGSEFGTSGLSILTGTGNGTFSLGGSYQAGGNPASIASGDLNEDSFADLIIADQHGGLNVFLNDGDGTFTKSPIIYAGGGLLDHVAIGDLNGDGHLDVMSSGLAESSLVLHFGDGDGTFGPESLITVGNTPVGAVISDLNEDGNLDLICSNQGDSTVSVVLGNGDGTFDPQVSYAVDNGPGQLVVSDLNGDGISDIAEASGGGSISILIGNGDGTFDAQISIPSGGTGTWCVNSSDFNDDGLNDLVVTNYYNSSIHVLINSVDFIV